MQSTIKTGVIGYPVGHSLSPLIHNHWIKYYGFPALYQTIEIVPEKLEESVGHLVEEGYIGFNVTLPHKQNIIELCDLIDETARRIGAVNTVLITDDGRLRGMNTDSYGFVENILHAECPVDLTGSKALVLGAGGAARAVVHGLSSMGVRDIKISNRTRERAEEIGMVFPVKVIDWEQREQAAEDVSIVVNTTSLGMSGQPALEFDLEQLPSDAAVCDIVYKPLETDLLKNAKERGNPVITGIGMLLHQARPAFREWFGIMPEITDELQDKVLKGLD